MDGKGVERKNGEEPEAGKSSKATAVRQSRRRKRKGSLRKAALAKMRERSAPSRQGQDDSLEPYSRTNASASLHPPSASSISHASEPLKETSSGPAQDHEDSSVASSESSFDESDHALPELKVPSISLNSLSPYASTTDEDDTQLPHLSASTSVSSLNLTIPATMSTTRRRSSRSKSATTSPIAPHPSSLATDLDAEWDYTETARWGWVILISTWLVFVVVMGSCFGVWGWVWDVGETPYAPPELEDDATLPITGYYPALMVCTAVMSWVWVVVAWVGMKYFRHAKVVGDEG